MPKLLGPDEDLPDVLPNGLLLPPWEETVRVPVLLLDLFLQGVGDLGGGSPEVWDYIEEDMDLGSGRLVLHIDVTEPWRGVLDREIEERVRFAQGLVGRRSRGVKGLPALYADIVLVARNLDTESPAKIAHALKEEIKKKYGYPYGILPRGKQKAVREHIRKVLIRAKEFGHLPR